MILDIQDIENSQTLVIDNELLENNQFSNIMLFSDPVKALIHYQQSPPNIVLLGIGMPVFLTITY